MPLLSQGAPAAVLACSDPLLDCPKVCWQPEVARLSKLYACKVLWLLLKIKSEMNLLIMDALLTETRPT